MNLEDILIYCKICKGDTFFKVSEEEHVSQSTVSKAIIRLEDFLGKKLIDRGRGRHTFKLTQDGRIFLQYARNIEQNVEKINRCFSINGTHKVKILATNLTLTYVIPKIFSSYSNLCSFEYDQSQNITITNGNIKIMESAIERPSDSIFQATLFRKEELFLVAAKDNASVQNNNLEELSYLACSEDCPLSQCLENFFKLYHISNKKFSTISDIHSLINMLSMSNKVALLPADFISCRNDLKKVPLDQKVYLYYYLVNRNDIQGKDFEVFKLLKKELDSLLSDTIQWT